MKIAQDKRGLTLVELIVSTAILSIVILSISNLYLSNIRTLSASKARALAAGLANEKMEYLKNLPYDSLATQYGAIYPAGSILDSQIVTSGNYKFVVNTQIVFTDDPYDGNLAGTIPNKPVDLYPYDYKKAEIKVYLEGSSQLLSSISANIAAKAAETASNTGILSISVIDANGQPVPQANVTITNSTVSPAVNINTTTDNAGLVVVPKLPPDNGNDYHIVTSLSGYNSDQTNAPTGGAQVAVNPDPNVLIQQVTDVTLAIDRLSSMTINVVDTSGAAITNLPITITGQKLNYTSPDSPKTIINQSTNQQGAINLTNIEWDSYSFGLPGGYFIVSSSPYQAVALNPNSSQTVDTVITTSSSYPRITAVSPISASTGSSNVIVGISGANFSGSPQIVLRKSGQPDITGGVSLNSSTSMDCTFDLSAATIGSWDLLITVGGVTITQSGGFNVTN